MQRIRCSPRPESALHAYTHLNYARSAHARTRARTDRHKHDHAS